ncbi:hypothetical protein BDV96DRAFT_17233 [Lophiotrema nucula]|uniref:Cora-like Mg2+ transporter protein-domain-containing protein n=1 Tax=Lophiotrema nucula TaxID=690887 RepID=A0A6A5ZBY9_9PLEO|nr:hypothetical protein BDV96DRAFT_17233 [Lophiotrema nucula]
MALERQSTGLSAQPSADSRSTKCRATLQDSREYAKRLSEYSKLNPGVSLFAGGHFENLATYLNQPYDTRAPNFMRTQDDNDMQKAFKFVSIYDLDPSKERKPRHFDSVPDFEVEAVKLTENSSHGHLIFMRGHPSPEWLLSISTRYQIDPEYLQRHLDFWMGQPECFPLPSLPSTMASMVRLKITTIGGSQNPPSSSNKQEHLDSLRSENTAVKQKYKDQLKAHKTCQLGDSILRDCSIHDLCHFSLEQDISIHICATRKSWAGIIWLDHGNPLSVGLASSLSLPVDRKDSWQIRYLPTIQHKPGVALRSRSKLLAPVSSMDRNQSSMPQSASLLHLDYGRGLDRTALAQDPLYALYELFTFAAFSEVQFLNMLDSKMKLELDHLALIRQESTTLSNLVYHQQVLDRHITRIRENLTWIEKTCSSNALERDKSKEGMVAANTLRQDYQHLLERAQGLLEQCNRGMQIVMNNAMVKESREAIRQAEGVAKLTRLAFIFIPLSFTCSFFGMNFAQFGTGNLAIWVWFVVSLPIVTLSLFLMRWEVSSLWRCFSRRKNKTGVVLA